MPRTNKSPASKAGTASAGRQTAKQRLQAEASALGLSDAGTMPEIQARIEACLESCADTAASAYAPSEPVKAQKKRSRLDPTGPMLLGGALGAAWHFWG